MDPLHQGLIRWLVEQRSFISGGSACILLVVTLVMQFGLGLVWPYGYVMATVFGIVAITTASRE